MDDALAVQSFLIQRLVGPLVAESPVITGSQPWAAARGCRPLSLLLIYSSCMIRDQSQKAGDAGKGERSGAEDRAEGGERSDYELSGPSHTAGLTERIMSEFKYTLHSCPFIWHRGPPPHGAQPLMCPCIFVL